MRPKTWVWLKPKADLQLKPKPDPHLILILKHINKIYPEKSDQITAKNNLNLFFSKTTLFSLKEIGSSLGSF